MEYGILPTLTKTYILNKLSQEQIFERYLGIKVEIGTSFKCPVILRPNDRNPTCSFYYNENGKLRFRDFAGFWGDCFDLVAYLSNVNANDKRGFLVVLDRIARDFNIHKYEGKNTEDSNTFDVRDANTRVKKTKTVIQFQPRNWTKQDADFWLAGNINKKGLEFHRVYAIMYIWINGELKYNFNAKDPAYGYAFTKDDIKIYFPKRSKYRFLSNTSYLQGKDLILPDRVGIITKSYKDVMSLRSFGIQSVALSSESTPLRKEEYWDLKYTFNHLYSLMDFDKQGVKMTNILRDKFNINPLFFGSKKRETFCNNNHYDIYENVKDFYDFVKENGKKATENLIINNTKYFESQYERYDSEMYNQTYWLKKDKPM